MAYALYSTYQSGLMYGTFTGQHYPLATGLAIGLTGPPPTVNSIVEVANAANYTRQPYSQTTAAWSYLPNSGIMYNNNQITFPVANAYLGWVSGIFIADSWSYGAGVGSTTGSILYYGTFSPAKEIAVNDQLYISPSSLSIRMY